MENVYVSARKSSRQWSARPLLFFFFMSVVLVVAALCIQGEYNGLREELIENLTKEREIADANAKLKMELSVITRARYIELKANERLGLKKPKEEEVLVLR